MLLQTDSSFSKTRHKVMYSNLFFTFTMIAAAFFTCFVTGTAAIDSCGSTEPNISVRIQNDDVNDTILEVFHNCNCVAYYQCNELSQYIIGRTSGLLSVECSDPNYDCCQIPDKDDKPETNDVTKSTTTTVKPSIADLVSKNTLINATCGVPKTTLSVRILNPEADSVTTIPGEHPWMVEIFEKVRNKEAYRFICAGSLIHPRVVLTALHCVRSTHEQSLKVVATGKEVFQNLEENPANERNVLKIVQHPKYYSGGFYNDIALLILQGDFEYSDYLINSICLPDSNQVLDGKKCLAVGWGENREHADLPLKKVDVPIVNSDECESLLRKTRLGSGFNLHESFLCAGGEEGKDTCNGDGGSPLICLGGDYKYIQVGIVSWGVNCGVVNEPGLYTNVAHFKDWIIEQLRNNDINI